MKCLIDFETRSEAPLTGIKGVGAAKYAEHPSTAILCLGYQIDGGERKLWLPGAPFPAELIAAVEAGATFEAHGAGFEKVIWNNLLTMRNIAPYPQHWKDTMAVCAYRGLPQGLDDVGNAINLPVQKDKRGKHLINRLCRRHKPSKTWPTGWVEVRLEGPPDETPAEERQREKSNIEAAALYQELYDYCLTDLCTEDVLGDVLGDLPEPEQFLWLLDQAINERGIQIDMEFVEAAIFLAGEIKKELTAELVELTGGEVQTHNQVAEIIKWLHDRGSPIPNLQADTVAEWMVAEADPDDYVYHILSIRQALAKSSVAKYQKIKVTTCRDGRVKGTLNYHGAGRTGRWAGRGCQPQNLKRGTVKMDMDNLVTLIKRRDLAALRGLCAADPMEALASAVRGAFVPKEGHDFIVSDFSAIEARVTAWVAGELWKLQVFVQGKDVYCETASDIFGYPVNKDEHPDERQVGKTCELAFGYGGGIRAFRNFDDSDRHTDEAVEEYKRAWRRKHPMIVKLWYGLERAAGRTVADGKPHEYRGIRYELSEDRAGAWLACVLPTGRRLWYYDPRVKVEDGPYGLKYEVSYMGRNNKGSGKWDLVRTWGGMLTENVVQAISRDLLAEAMIRVEAAGYRIVLHAHDEIVSEIMKRFGSQEEFDALVSVVPAWAKSLPIDAKGWRGERYHK